MATDTAPEKKVWLLPVDATPGTDTALRWTLDHLYKTGDELHFFHGITELEPQLIGGGVGLGDIADFIYVEPDPSLEQKQVQEAQAFMQQHCADVAKAAHADYRMEIRHCGSDQDAVGDAICKRANQLSAAAVVMLKHNRRRISEFLLGSVANYCTKHCKQPVIFMH